MPKITHVFKTYFPETNGGLEEAIRQIGRHSIRDGYRVEVVAAGAKSYELSTPDNITVKFHESLWDLYSNPVSLPFMKQFKTICKNTDILHFHFTWPTAEILTLIHSVSNPMVVTFHCDIHKNKFLKTLYRPIMKRFLKRADKICVTSRNLFLNTPCLHEFQRKVEEVPLWLDEQRFSGLSGPDKTIIDFVKECKPYGLFAGVLRWYKGLEILLEASRKFNGDIVIVGKGSLYRQLKKQIKKENLNHVHLLGFQSDSNLKYLIQNCRFVVLPSITPAEAFGQILLEGLYFSKPLISTELGTGTSLVNRHNRTGLVVKPGNVASLASAMNRMCLDELLHERLTSGTFYHYKMNFSEAVQGKKYSQIYESLTE
ncbi:rhamnosyl/mannosyltransferase [Desulfocicer vacuolatum DSM 3385]|uniref:Rhamnosyl/mannosyltransferase n=1 Tax=Desulfocicer vacuolatum DSM 3385 TaxID=1121400 RepID=A0A1W2BTW3_9BACT|nr:glycosyltransferase [Desulfocicer vacuolatum]SMC76329.1 rhamnosyl/mannosyltransferase [Desulfocicer vacuolatum DSM 3385]